MEDLVFATHNVNKVAEIDALLGGEYNVLSLTDIGCTEEIPETADTLDGNALIKARYVWKHYQRSCFADDTGLEVDALNGAPGIYSARYAGPDCIDANNIQKLLEALKDKKNRTAQFRTSIALILNGEEHLFEGIVTGEILTEPSGEGGFGYDPVFMPDDHNVSFAEMSRVAKNEISHRGKAVRKLVAFLTDF